jgi:hypothetical protein
MCTINRSLEEKAHSNDTMEALSTPAPSQFLTPKVNLQAGAPRLVDSSPPIIVRQYGAIVPVSEMEAQPAEVLKRGKRASPDRDERKLETPPTASGFDEFEFILAVPSAVGMVSRDNSFSLDSGCAADDTGSLRCVMDEFSWEMGAIAQECMRQREEDQFQDQAHEVRFRPIQESDSEVETTVKPRFKLPRTGLRLQPRPSRVDWEALQSANPFI